MPRPFHRPAIFAILIAIAPALFAVLVHRWFVPQDGPAHLYNAHILAKSLGSNSPFAATYEVSWTLLPNWLGHLATMVAVTILPAAEAGRLIAVLTFVGVFAAVVWLRKRIAGRVEPVTILLASLLSLSLPWLLGFTSYLLGECLFAITLAVWWGGRNRMGVLRTLGVSALLVVGYFAHPISLGATLLGLGVLGLWTPSPAWKRRLIATFASMVPLAPLIWEYRRLMARAGPIHPIWGTLKNPWSATSWGDQLLWVDPLTLAMKTTFPFVATPSNYWRALAPSAWCLVGLALLFGAMIVRREHPVENDRRGWLVLAAVLLMAGFAGPDTLGAEHGNYLPQRLILLGLIALVPFFDFDDSQPLARLASVVLAVAALVQSAIVWDYAAYSNRAVSELVEARAAVGQGQRVGSLMLDLRSRYRANPLLHADCFLGIGTGSVIWSNYEAAHYYFPVQIRRDVAHPPIEEFEWISILDEPSSATIQALRWSFLLAEHHQQIDRVVFHGRSPLIDGATLPWFEPVYDSGRVRVFRSRRQKGDGANY